MTDCRRSGPRRCCWISTVRCSISRRRPTRSWCRLGSSPRCAASAPVARGAVAVSRDAPRNDRRASGRRAGAVAGEHGGAIRPGPAHPWSVLALDAARQQWIDAGAGWTRRIPAACSNAKPRGFGVHFRLAPEAGPAIHAALAALIADPAEFELMQGHMLWEVRPRGVDKGEAVEQPDAAAAVSGPARRCSSATMSPTRTGCGSPAAMGGAGLRVQDFFGDAAGVRAWLRETAARGDLGGRPRMKLTDFKVMSFDCYGTLIDWESGILSALRPLVASRRRHAGRRGDPGQFAAHESAQQAATPGLRYADTAARRARAARRRLGRRGGCGGKRAVRRSRSATGRRSRIRWRR